MDPALNGAFGTPLNVVFCRAVRGGGGRRFAPGRYGLLYEIVGSYPGVSALMYARCGLYLGIWE